MKRHSPVIVVTAALCSLHVVRHWWTPLLTDAFLGLGIPLCLVLLLGSLVSALIVMWLLPQTEANKTRTKSAAVMLALVVSSLVFDSVYARGLPTGSFATVFDSEEWKSNDASKFQSHDLTTRQKMLGYVVADVLPRQNRTAIEAQLGIPPTSSYFEELKPDLLYHLGPERGVMGIDSEWLALWFNSDGYLDSWKLLRD